MNYTSAGTILISYIDRKILLIKHPEGHWGFPKGFIEDGETSFHAAQRELFEETGIECNFFIDPKKYNYEEHYICLDSNSREIVKKVVYYIGVTCNTECILNNLLDDYGWFNLDELYSLDNFFSTKIINELEGVIRCRILWNSDIKTDEKISYNDDIMPSKHAFSRVAPLMELSHNVSIKNPPNILDSYYIYEILKKSKYLKSQPLILHTQNVNNCWSSINMLPFLIYKHKCVILKGKPNGCRIGKRPIDLYLDIMSAFGFQIVSEEKQIVFHFGMLNKRISFTLPFPSFTGTSIAIYCAMMNNAETCISNISLEPEIIFLVECIKKMGYQVNIEERNLYFTGYQKSDSKVEITIPPDRNVLITRIIDALYNNKSFFYTNKSGLYLSSLTKYFDKIGLEYKYDHLTLEISAGQLGKMQTVSIVCDHYPELCSDWQPLLVLLSLKNSGKAVVQDKVFEKRYEYVSQIGCFFENMSSIVKDNIADITCGKNTSISNELHLECLDIRASAVLFILAEKNKNIIISNIDQLLRGYSAPEQVSDYFVDNGGFEFEEK